MPVAWVQHFPRRSFLITIEPMAVYRTVRSIAPRRKDSCMLRWTWARQDNRFMWQARRRCYLALRLTP